MSAASARPRLDLVVPAEAAGQRLDRFLTASVEGTVRSAVSRWIADGRVLVDGRLAAKAGLALRAGMHLSVDPPDPPASVLVPETVPFEVLHEDAEIAVVNKPAGIAVHPGHGRRTGTLVHGLLGRGIRLSPLGAPDRPGIVHRLDLGTSGALVVAKTERAHRALARDFAARRVGKRYLALVWGRPAPPAGRIERAIGRSRRDPTRMAVRETRGAMRQAATDYRTLETLGGFTLLQIAPETGRTHQIRVHLESIRHPIVGDERYGPRSARAVQDPRRRKALRTFARLALHASRLEFRHPTEDRPLRFDAPLPEDFLALLDALRDAP